MMLHILAAPYAWAWHFTFGGHVTPGMFTYAGAAVVLVAVFLIVTGTYAYVLVCAAAIVKGTCGGIRSGLNAEKPRPQGESGSGASSEEQISQ